ncbi:MAG: hypothetical protein KDD42_03710 [Bdellovibrionales bacterium]|nr:hypothetical protein [Bdellovibrionales bacterium]
MVEVRINGETSQIKADNLPRMSDLIELIKNWIDPDHMITQILLDGRDLEDAEWTAPLGQYETAILEIETGTPQSFVDSRLGQASEVLKACYFEFRDARKFFQSGDMQTGNRLLVKAVNTLQAFFEWYSTILELVPVEGRNRYDITKPVTEISEICKKICQQQLYQSWWALGEAIEKELEPKIDALEDICRGFARAA